MRVRKHALVWVLQAALVGTTLVFAAATPASAVCAVENFDCEPGLPGWGGSGSTSSTGTTVTGVFRYGDRDAGNNSFPRPISGAKVEIWRYRPGWFGVWSWNHDATTNTFADGRFSVQMPYQQSGIKYAVRVFATNRSAVVWPSGGWSAVPFWTEPGEPNAPIQKTVWSDGATISFDYDFNDEFRAGHFNLAETARHGAGYVHPRRGGDTDLLPPVNIQPGGSSWYNPTNDTVNIETGSMLKDGEVLHEYSHYVEELIGAMPWIPTWHDGCVAKQGPTVVNSPEHAWMEGFADYLAMAIIARNPGANLNPSGGTLPVSQMETPSCSSEADGIPGDAIEKRVAGVLWDLFDSNNEPGDTVSGMDSTILQIMDNELDADRGQGDPTINRFRSAWIARGLSITALDSIMQLNGVPIR